jgi:pyruvate formate lyase activating enzyme
MKAQCDICPHRCSIEEGHTGLCRARGNRNGVIVDENYGVVTSLALDPIEKKPLYRFFPGSRILSAGSYGCNLRCPFCQTMKYQCAASRYERSAYGPGDACGKGAGADSARGNIGLAFTYKEPLIGYEFVRDCAAIAHEREMKTVLVTNGYINEKPLMDLLPWIDAMNIDLKGFTEEYYRKLGGSLKPVLRAIELAQQNCHVEVTTLIVPEENDSPAEMRRLSAWLAGIRADIPMHISRFFPRYKMADRDATDVEQIYALADVAREKLRYVYEGNC